MLITDKFPLEVPYGGALSITHKLLYLSDVIRHDGLFGLSLELLNRHSEALLSSSLANVVPRGLNVGHFACIHLLHIVLNKSRPSLTIHGVSKNALDWHRLKHFFPQAHDLLNKLSPEAFNL